MELLARGVPDGPTQSNDLYLTWVLNPDLLDQARPRGGP